MGFTTTSNTSYFGGGGPSPTGGDDVGYQKATFSAAAVPITADTWTTLFPGGTILSNSYGMPTGVTNVVNSSSVTLGSLQLNDVAEIDLEFTVTPVINNTSIKTRITMTKAGNEVSFEEDLETLSRGAGKNYRLKANWIVPIDDTDIISNPVRIEVLTTADAEIKTNSCTVLVTRT